MFENEISLEGRPIMEDYFSGYNYETSGLSFTSLYMWRNINDFSWQIIGDYMCIAGLSHLEIETKEPFMFPPLTKTGKYDKEALRYTITEAKKIFEEKGYEFTIRLMPSHMIEILEEAFPGEFEFIDDRPNYDYLYLAEDLAELKGREYHSKKNHLNYFLKNYVYEYIPLTSEMADDAMDFIREFNERKNLPPHEMALLMMEERAMRDVFYNLEKIGYVAAAIKIDNKIEALTIGGRLNKNTITVHVEKANIMYRGLYQAINNEFAKHLPPTIKYINREEDMGIPGLRKAKLSYKPIRLIECYIANFKKDRQ
ncbi:MAG: DUF2156 domain-containing protein [Anaerovoracaceae bacterium]|jgi:hypothetical protein